MSGGDGKPSAAWKPVDGKPSAACSGACATVPGIASCGATVSPFCEFGDNDEVDGATFAACSGDCTTLPDIVSPFCEFGDGDCTTLPDIVSPFCEYGDKDEVDGATFAACPGGCATLPDIVSPFCEYGDKAEVDGAAFAGEGDDSDSDCAPATRDGTNVDGRPRARGHSGTWLTLAFFGAGSAFGDGGADVGRYRALGVSVDEVIGDGGEDSGRRRVVLKIDVGVLDVGRCGVANPGSYFTSTLTSCIISLPLWSVRSLPFSSRVNRIAIYIIAKILHDIDQPLSGAEHNHLFENMYVMHM